MSEELNYYLCNLQKEEAGQWRNVSKVRSFSATAGQLRDLLAGEYMPIRLKVPWFRVRVKLIQVLRETYVN